MKQVWKVGYVASWDGWCSPCAREDRPLVLTRSGPAGLRAWLSGLDDEDRCLLLTCRVCGQWQVVPLHEEDDPEVVVLDDVLAPLAPLAPAAVAAAEPQVDVRPVAAPLPVAA